MNIIFCEGKYCKFIDEFGEEFDVYDEGAGWGHNNIYIHVRLNFINTYGAIIHEFIEMILESKFRWHHEISHFMANVGEFILSCGQSKQYWHPLKDLLK